MDREKVISAYECVITRGKSVCECGKCDYHIKDSAVFFCDNQRVLTDALALLKEQEAIVPEWYDGTPFCGNCGHRLEKKNRNMKEIKCPTCGRKVKWE